MRFTALVATVLLSGVAGCSREASAGRGEAQELPEPCRVTVDVPAAPELPIHVTLTLPDGAPDPIRLRAATEAVGMYAVADFGRFIQRVTIQDKSGAELLVKRAGWSGPDLVAMRTSESWTAAGRAKTISWDVDCAAGESALSDLLISSHRRNGYTLLSGYATFLLVDGLEASPIDVTYRVPEGWHVASALSRREDGSWRAANALELLDEPAMLGTAFVSAEVAGAAVRSTVHLFSESGGSAASELAVVAAAQMDAAAAVAALSLPSLDRPYHVFYELLRPSGDRRMGWALEHRQSSQYADDVTSLGSASPRLTYHLAHHLLHAWIPRRLYTDALAPSCQIRGAPTGAIWFAEGFPQYLACVGMARAGVAPVPVVLSLLARRFAVPYTTEVPKAPRSMMARSHALCLHAQDEWIFGFSEGALLAMWLDEKLRDHDPNGDGLPQVIRSLYDKWHDREDGIPEDKLASIFGEACGFSLAKVFARHVSGSEPLPVDEILDLAGIVRDGATFRVLAQDAMTPRQSKFRDSLRAAPGTSPK